MTMRIGYRSPERAALSAVRAVTGRVARGYWPEASALQPGGGLNAGQWVLYVVIKHDKPPRPSDAPRYEFEIRCEDESIARGAVGKFHSMLFAQVNKREAAKAKRSGKVESIGAALKRKHGEKKN